MIRSAARKNSSSEPDLFGAPAQADLFGPPPAPKIERYIPKVEHVRNSINSHLAHFAKIKTWWELEDYEIIHYRFKYAAYYTSLIPDPVEAGEWREKYRREYERLDAASGKRRPGEHIPWKNWVDPMDGEPKYF